jgi:hypothetical protein
VRRGSWIDDSVVPKKNLRGVFGKFRDAGASSCRRRWTGDSMNALE